ncbi:MAG: hypothetical protein NXI32_26955 [bacterium]|nr:hypothetical protein [bacterium]
MRQFVDNQGRIWFVSCTRATMRNVRKQTAFEPRELATNFELWRDASVQELVDLLYVICQQQAQSRGVNQEQFSQALEGCEERAVESLVLEIGSFKTKSASKLIRTFFE